MKTTRFFETLVIYQTPRQISTKCCHQSTRLHVVTSHKAGIFKFIVVGTSDLINLYCFSTAGLHNEDSSLWGTNCTYKFIQISEIWGTHDITPYRHGVISTLRYIDMAWYRHCVISTWRDIDIALYRHGVISTETSKMLHLEHSFVWCSNLDASGSRSEIPGKYWNVVLEKDGEDQLDRSYEKWRSVT